MTVRQQGRPAGGRQDDHGWIREQDVPHAVVHRRTAHDDEDNRQKRDAPEGEPGPSPSPHIRKIEKTIPTRTTGGVVIRNHVGRYDEGSLPAWILPAVEQHQTVPVVRACPGQRLERPGQRFGLRPGPEDRAQEQARDNHEAHPEDELRGSGPVHAGNPEDCPERIVEPHPGPPSEPPRSTARSASPAATAADIRSRAGRPAACPARAPGRRRARLPCRP